MVIEGVWPQPGHPNQITRMTYTPLADGSVEQAGVVLRRWRQDLAAEFRPHLPQGCAVARIMIDAGAAWRPLRFA